MKFQGEIRITRFRAALQPVSNISRGRVRRPCSGSYTSMVDAESVRTTKACWPFDWSIAAISTNTIGKFPCDRDSSNSAPFSVCFALPAKPSARAASTAFSASVPRQVQSHNARSSPSSRWRPNPAITMRKQAGTQESGVSCRWKGGVELFPVLFIEAETARLHFSKGSMRENLRAAGIEDDFARFPD